MTYDKTIVLIRYNEESKTWVDVATLHARINKTGGTEYLSSGAYQSKATLTFEVRYSSLISEIYLNTQLYRIRYKNNEYDLEDYDDYQERHMSVRLLGVARGV